MFLCWRSLFVAFLCLSTAFAQEAASPSEEEKPDPLAEEIKAARDLYHRGEYDEAFRRLERAEINVEENRRLTALKAQIRLAEGRYEEASDLVEDDWSFEGSQEGQMMLHDIKRAAGDFAAAADHAAAVFNSRRFATPSDLLAIGRAALLQGGEPKDILDRFYRQVEKTDPGNAQVFQYIGDLAFEKYDYELASENYDRGLQLEPNNTDLRVSLAKCFFETDRGHAIELLEKNLEINPRHVDSLLMMARHHLLAEFEDKSEAVAFIERAEKVNPNEPRPDAMRAVIALLLADEEGAEKFRQEAKQGRPQDPRIDYHMGEWMSSLMRFQEAVPYLRASVETDPAFLPAKISLGQNLLRTGDEAEAWVILEGVSDRDQYNVAVYNLLALHDEIEDYQIMNRENFIVRMESSEARLFGGRVLDLLEQAERDLHAKYAFTPSKPILIEFYPKQEDFAVRTFGFMGGDGFLGACFGLVVTMNSPNNGATGTTNWESTLWHEYCHAVTLGATKNRMPRWLTEGLSVYEERLRDPRCGHQMDSEFRHMILEGGELMPLTQLNYGFLKPKSPKHMMFAYYQSSLFVEYFMDTFGEEKMRSIIRDLREGVPFSQACVNHAESLPELEKAFFAYAKKEAEGYGEALDWELPEENLSAFSLEEIREWLKDRPTSYYGLRALGTALLRADQLDEAEQVFKQVIEAFPEQVGKGAVYPVLAEVHRRQGAQDQERDVLWHLVSHSTEWLDEMLLMLDYETEAEAWERVEQLTGHIMAINPYITKAQKALAESLTAQGKVDDAVLRYETLLDLDPQNPAQIHFAVADLLQAKEPERSRRHVLDALAEAPRYRDALRLLLKLKSTEEKAPVSQP